MQERITHPCKQKKEETNKMNETGKPSGGNSADLVVYGKIFTSENQTVEAFAVKDGRYVYAGDRKGARAFIEEGKTEVIDHTGKGLVMPSCGNGHAHYFTGHAMPMVGTVVGGQDDVDKFLKEIVPAAVEKAKAKATKPIEVNTVLEVKKVMADEQYLTEAIANLIDNALKYSKDEIEINIRTFDTDKNVLLKVRDNGIGITKEEQQVIFDKFGRAAIHEKNRKGGVSGFGLGLNYVDQVMQAHGGKVTVSSEKDKYSEFTLYIPKNV